ncbi:uncharacterized protein LOC144159617 [Haemaphysalis longicornis]
MSLDSVDPWPPTGTGRLPTEWLPAILGPIPKPRKGLVAVTAYWPVALTTCGCKLLERVALRRMNAYVAGEEAIPEHLTGFRRHRAATADVVATLEHARASKQVRPLVLQDV